MSQSEYRSNVAPTDGVADRRARWEDRESAFRRELLSDVETVDADEARTLLTVAGRAPNLAALCADGQLMVLKGEAVDRYPAFQFDRKHSETAGIVAYANTKVGAATDPWGAADWWRTPSRVLGDRTPMDVLTAGELTRVHIDLIGKYELR